MKENQAFLVSLLKKTIKNEEHHTALVGSLSKDSYKDISMYGLRSILYPSDSIGLIDDEIKRGIYEDWTRYMQRGTMSNLLFMQRAKLIIELFHSERITPIVLKGLSIARLYRNPEYRFMEDIDLLVHPDEWERSKELLTNNGYIQEEDDDYHPMHIKYTKAGGIPVELHSGLVHTGYLKERDAKDWYESIWKNKKLVSIDQTQMLSLSPEDELINQVVHFANHFVYYGVRLKHLYEISLIIQSYNAELNWNYISDILKKLDFYDFGSLILSTCRKYFDVNVPLEHYQISDGVLKSFMEDFLTFYCTESIYNTSGYLSILVRYRFLFKYRILFQPLLWAIALKSQYKIYGFKLDKLFRNVMSSIKHINRKIKTIRKFKLA